MRRSSTVENCLFDTDNVISLRIVKMKSFVIVKSHMRLSVVMDNFATPATSETFDVTKLLE